MLDSESDIRRFLDGTPWAGSVAVPLAGDASSRRYFRLCAPEGSAVLMQDPTGNIGLFSSLARHLRDAGLSAPEILREDALTGFMLLEDLGDDVLACHVVRERQDEARLYIQAVDTLAALQGIAPPSELARPDAATMADLVDPLAGWYLPEPDPALHEQIVSLLAPALARVFGDLPTVFCHRDYHAENLICLPGRAGVAAVGLLDFQDAFVGPPVYDLVSLVEDARRDLSPGIRDAVVARFADRLGVDQAMVARHVAVVGAQRNLRILGVFARLSRSYGKPRYVDLIPRVWDHLQGDLAHPELAALRDLLAARLPEPDAEHLARLRQPCPTP